MVRPRKCRMVQAPPNVTYYKPGGVRLRELDETCLSVEGYEALRLADYHNMNHEQAADQMGVSRQTFGRILGRARQTVATALVEGIALRIEGGDYELSNDATEDLRPRKKTGSGCKMQGRQPEPMEAKNMPKIAISSQGPGLDELLDPRFGRAAGLVIVDPESLEFDYIDNGKGQVMAQGAGIQAAEKIADAGATAILTGYVGPKAFAALEAVGIRVGLIKGEIPVRQVIERFLKGEVEWAL